MNEYREIKAGIVGGSGYTGVELLRLLLQHPQVTVTALTSRSEAGRPVVELFPSLRQQLDLTYVSPNDTALTDCDVIFFATPNGVAMNMAPALLEKGIKIIDLAADFRLKDVRQWERWYKQPHACPELLNEAVYGLPEVNRKAISQARLVANPGCYPTAVQLGFLPLLKHGLVAPDSLIADAKSGASGAGRTLREDLLFSEVHGNFRAYGAGGHRHHPEISQGLAIVNDGKPVSLTFVPHLVPMVRGIHATLYARLKEEINHRENFKISGDFILQSIYEDMYKSECFVDVLPQGSHPETGSVLGSNFCRLSVLRPESSDQVIVLSVIDNLVKGAAGQAIQNMNIMSGFPEEMGLMGPPMYP
ncbi:MAG: N-acetyl-gamma-glutamyl-phosphate reductase [Gammaproteobacteria bacterium]|nr:MAG: N-acetyl-gamma-glutamyl-phosphate reductase [Gammaproteobacteria bacterium]